MRVRSQRLLFARIRGRWMILLAAWAGAPASALGQVPEKGELSPSAPPAPFVFGSAECPDPKTVQQGVLSLIPPERQALLEHGVRVELEDLGDSYRVTVWNQGVSVNKSYSDPARECDSRSRFAAVFTVLTLMPPELGAQPIAKAEPEPTPLSPPVAKPAPAPRAEPTHAPNLPLLVHLELSALYASAPAILEAPSLHSFGAELRLALGRGALSGTVSVAYTPPAQFDSNGVQGDLARLPLSVGARLHTDLDAWSLAAELGLLLVPQRVRASNLLIQHTQSSADFGVRAGIQVARQFGPHFAPFFGAFVWLTPVPSELSALPQGVFANLPYLWLGGAAGVSFGL